MSIIISQLSQPNKVNGITFKYIYVQKYHWSSVRTVVSDYLMLSMSHIILINVRWSETKYFDPLWLAVGHRVRPSLQNISVHTSQSHTLPKPSYWSESMCQITSTYSGQILATMNSK